MSIIEAMIFIACYVVGRFFLYKLKKLGKLPKKKVKTMQRYRWVTIGISFIVIVFLGYLYIEYSLPFPYVFFILSGLIAGISQELCFNLEKIGEDEQL